MASGKHSGNPRDYEQDNNYDYNDYYEEERNFNYKKILIIVGIIIIIVMVGFLLYKFVFAKPEEIQEPVPVQESKSKMIETLEGYDVLGKVVIEKIDVEQYILDSTEEKALENGIGKIYGGSLNNYGNLCLIGHNYDKIFARLTELEVGDEITLIDDELLETNYKIKEIFSIEPDNLECMVQPEDKIELTLITCETGATTRLVIKAEEIKQSTEDTENTNTINTETNSVKDSEENV